MASSNGLFHSSAGKPTLAPLSFGGDEVLNCTRNAGNAPGFLGNGDFFELPTSDSQPFTYKDKGGNVIWQKTIGDMAPGGETDKWAGFAFVGSLIYCFAQDTSTSPTSLYTTTVDVSGILDRLGSFQYNANPATAPSWNTPTTSTGSCSFSYDSENNLFYMAVSLSGGAEDLVIDATDGSVVRNFQKINNTDLSAFYVSGIRSSSGTYLTMAGWASSNGDRFACALVDEEINSTFYLDRNCGLPAMSNEPRLMYWKGYIWPHVPGAASNFDGLERAYALEDMDEFIDSLKREVIA